ncbi:MAG: undecaprenyl-phosphate glucose phosphotransferase [Acidobacteriota bacterium]
MTKNFDIRTVLTDFVTLNLAWFLYFLFRVHSGIAAMSTDVDLWMPMLLIYLYWCIVFIFFGLYRSWHAASRTDEFAAIFKTISIGCLLLFFIVFIDDTTVDVKGGARTLMLAYWGIMLATVGAGRMVYRSTRKRLLQRGIGLRNAVIVGLNEKGKELCDLLTAHPALGYRVSGFVKVDKRKTASSYKGIPVLGSLETIDEVITAHTIKDVMISLETSDHDKLLDIISRVNGRDVSLKIQPDMYDIISGQARTNQLYGVPLIEIMPRIMQPWEESAKRIVDIVVSLSVLVVSSPLWIAIGIAIKLDSPGPVVYSQERVGKDEKLFKMHKFRSMRADAESKSGPVWAPKNDTRVTRIGKFLRKTRLDEIPQFINVLAGEMSLVGPRPERPFFVEKLSKEIPLYKRRLAVRPGITGWAQIKQGYDTSIDDVRSKVRYDLFYIENMSFRMDIKILLTTVYVMVAGKGN